MPLIILTTDFGSSGAYVKSTDIDLELAGRRVRGVAKTDADGGGAPIALLGSGGFREVAPKGSSGAVALAADRGAALAVRFR